VSLFVCLRALSNQLHILHRVNRTGKPSSYDRLSIIHGIERYYYYKNDQTGKNARKKTADRNQIKKDELRGEFNKQRRDKKVNISFGKY
jgi:hypothetical protein